MYRRIWAFIILGILVMVLIIVAVKSKECSEVTAADHVKKEQTVNEDKPKQDSIYTENAAVAEDVKTAETEEYIEEDNYDFETLAASVVKLEVFNAKGDRIGTGSGFAAYDESILITARHVIVNMDHMTATRDDGSTFRINRTIIADEKTDIAICALPEDARLVPLVFAEEMPRRGSDTAVISSQFGIPNLVTKGNVCGYWETGDSEWLVFTAPVSGGSSGGPLFDEKGHVIGIVSGTYEKGQNLNIAAPSEAAIEICRALFE